MQLTLSQMKRRPSESRLSMMASSDSEQEREEQEIEGTAAAAVAAHAAQESHRGGSAALGAMGTAGSRGMQAAASGGSGAWAVPSDEEMSEEPEASMANDENMQPAAVVASPGWEQLAGGYKPGAGALGGGGAASLRAPRLDISPLLAGGSGQDGLGDDSPGSWLAAHLAGVSQPPECIAGASPVWVCSEADSPAVPSGYEVSISPPAPLGGYALEEPASLRGASHEPEWAERALYHVPSGAHSGCTMLNHRACSLQSELRL